MAKNPISSLRFKFLVLFMIWGIEIWDLQWGQGWDFIITPFSCQKTSIFA
jgi:hypothetical protein